MLFSKCTAILPLAFTCAALLPSCYSYQRSVVPAQRLEKIYREDLNFYLLDEAHPYTRGWYMVASSVSGKAVEGFASRMSEKEVVEVNLLRNQADEQRSNKDILIFLEPTYASQLTDTATVRLTNHEMVKIEACEVDYVRSCAPALIGCNALLILLYLIGGNW